MTEKYDGPWQDSLSEESRQMIEKESMRIWQDFFDQISFTPKPPPNQNYRVSLGMRLRSIAIDMQLSGEELEANVLMLAAQELMDNE